jgi:hypothetical protein
MSETVKDIAYAMAAGNGESSKLTYCGWGGARIELLG